MVWCAEDRRTCGTHFGDTKAVASTTERPVSLNLLMSSTFVSVAITCFSFCSPSRAPTSTILTNLGRSVKNFLVGATLEE